MLAATLGTTCHVFFTRVDVDVCSAPSASLHWPLHASTSRCCSWSMPQALGDPQGAPPCAYKNSPAPTGSTGHAVVQADVKKHKIYGIWSTGRAFR